MPVDLGSVGSVYVDVGADLSGLTSQISAISGQADALGKEIGASLSTGISEGVTDSATGLQSVVQAVEQVGTASGAAEGPTAGLTASLTEMAGAFGLALAGEELVTMLRDLVQESIEAYGKIELVTSGLTALTGSAETTEAILSQLKDIASGSTFSFPELAQAAQKMAAIGVAATQIGPALQAVSDAAMVTGNSFDGVSSALDRIYLSATINPRTLSQLGISLQDLADTAGISADKVKEAFTALGPQSDQALQLLTATIERRTGDAAAAMKGDLLPSINAVKVEWDSLLEDFGKEIAPNVKQLLSAIEEILPSVQQVAIILAQIASGDISGVISDWQSLEGFVRLIVPDFISAKNAASLLKDVLDEAFNVPAITVFKDMVDSLGKAWLPIIATIDTLTGKYTDFNSAILALNAQLTGQADGLKLVTTAGDTLTSQQENQIASAVNARAQVLLTTEGYTDYGTAVAAATQQLIGYQPAIEQLALKQHDQATATNEAAQAARDALQAQADEATRLEALKTALEDVNKATSLVAAANKEDYTPSILDVTTADHDLALAEAEHHQAASDVLDALQKLQAITNQAKPSTTDLAAATKDLNDKEEILAGTAISLSEAKKTDTASTSAAKAATDLLTKAQKDLTDAYAADAVGTVSLEDAEQSLYNLQAQKLQQEQDLKTAETDLQNLRAQGILSGTDYAAAVTKVKTADDNLLTTEKQISATQKTINTDRQDASKIAQQLATDEAAINKVYQDLYPNTTDLTGALDSLNTARTQEATAVEQANSDLIAYNAIVQTGVTNSPAALDAAAKLKKSKEDLATAAKAVTLSEQDLQKNFGLTQAAARLLSDDTEAYVGTEQQLDDALTVTGQTTLPKLQAAIEAADKAVQTIIADGGSWRQVNNAEIKDIEAKTAAWEAQGVEVPASVQAQLANLTQQEQTYQAASVTRWTNMSNTIYSTFNSTFSSMDQDIVSGNFAKVVTDWQTGLEKMGAAVLDAFTKPASTAIAQFLATSVTDLLTGTGKISDAWSQLGTNISKMFGKGGTVDLSGTAGDLSGVFNNINSTGATGGTGPVDLSSAFDYLKSDGTDLSTAASDLSTSASGLSTAGSSLTEAGGSIAQSLGTGASAASSSTGGIGSGIGSGISQSPMEQWTSLATAINTTISAVLDVLNHFTLTEIKDRLNNIENNTWGTVQGITMAGGVFDSTAHVDNWTHMLLDDFNGWNRDILTAGGDAWQGAFTHLAAIRYDLLTPMLSTLEGIGTGLAALASMNQQTPVFNLKVQLDTGQVMDAITTNLAQQGVRST